MKEILSLLIEHKKLSAEQAKQALFLLTKGDANKSQAAAFLTVFLMRNISVDELEGFRSAMLELCIPANLDEFDPIDLCGTGGDGKNTFNISTISSFVVAGAGVKVAKHGNNGVSSICGSSNIMAALGYNFTNDIDQLRKEMETSGICFLHAPLFHPAMKEVAPVRKELGMKTFFNMLGPLVNPAQPKKQLIGVFDLELARRYQYLLQDKMKSFTIVHSLGGYDEVSLTSPFKVITRKGEDIKTPEDYGFATISAENIKGGKTIEESVKILVNILKNKGSDEQHEVIIANAALAIATAKGISVEDAKIESVESLKSGRAYKCLEKLLEISKKPRYA